MMIRIAALLLAALAACAKGEAPTDAPAPAALAEPAAPAADDMAVAETAVADTEDAVAACPVLDSRNWKASTAPSANGHALTIEGEIDLPTPGYAIAWRAGVADRAMPPGLRVHLDANPPADLVMQVVTPTPVSWTMDEASPRYRVVYVLCGDEAIAEIADVGPKG